MFKRGWARVKGPHGRSFTDGETNMTRQCNKASGGTPPKWMNIAETPRFNPA
jgi:hypothetical protein